MMSWPCWPTLCHHCHRWYRHPPRATGDGRVRRAISIDVEVRSWTPRCYRVRDARPSRDSRLTGRDFDGSARTMRAIPTSLLDPTLCWPDRGIIPSVAANPLIWPGAYRKVVRQRSLARKQPPMLREDAALCGYCVDRWIERSFLERVLCRAGSNRRRRSPPRSRRPPDERLLHKASDLCRTTLCRTLWPVTC